MRSNSLTPSIPRNIVLLALATCFVAGLTVESFGAGKGNSTAGKVTILDLPGNRIRSDGKGTSVNGVDRVTAVIHESGMLDLDTNITSTRRSVVFDYSELLLGTGCNRTGDPGVEIPDLNCDGLPGDPALRAAWGRLVTLDLNLLTLAPGETRLGGFGLRFHDGCSSSTGVFWTIRLQHQGIQDSVYWCGVGCGAQVKVEAFDAVAGKGIAGTGVDKWIISAEVSAGSGAEACLWSGGTGDPVLREIVRMPFHLVVELK